MTADYKKREVHESGTPVVSSHPPYSLCMPSSQCQHRVGQHGRYACKVPRPCQPPRPQSSMPMSTGTLASSKADTCSRQARPKMPSDQVAVMTMNISCSTQRAWRPVRQDPLISISRQPWLLNGFYSEQQGASDTGSSYHHPSVLSFKKVLSHLAILFWHRAGKLPT